MNVEKTLADELGAVARSIGTPPPPDAASLMRQAGRETTRSRRAVAVVSSLVAAVVVGAIVLGGQLAKPDASPAPTPQPTGPAPTAPPTPIEGVVGVGEPIQTWVDSYGRLHLNGTTFTDHIYANALTTGDLTTSSTGEYDGGDTAVFLGTTRVGTLRNVYESLLPVSPDARTIAYTAFTGPDRQQIFIVVARVSEDGVTELGRLEVDAMRGGIEPADRERLFKVDDDGTVTYGGVIGSRGHTWTPGGEPQPADTGAFTGTPTGFEPVNRGNANGQITLNRQGTWGAWPTDPDTSQDPESPTFSALVVQRPGDPASRWTFDFSEDYAYANLVFWESETTVILYADRKPPGQQSDGDYVRCDVVERRCEIAPEPPGSNTAP